MVAARRPSLVRTFHLAASFMLFTLAACDDVNGPLPRLTIGTTSRDSTATTATTTTTATSAPLIAGTWVGRNIGSSVWGDSLVLRLVVTDTVVSGTYQSVRGGVRETYSGRVAGAQVGSTVRLTLTFDPYEHGCTGSLRVCFPLVLGFTGTLTAQQTLVGTFDDQRTTWAATLSPGAGA